MSLTLLLYISFISLRDVKPKNSFKMYLFLSSYTLKYSFAAVTVVIHFIITIKIYLHFGHNSKFVTYKTNI